MKQIIAILVLTMTLQANANAQQPQHRHSTTVQATAPSGNDDDTKGVSAYSDTTTVDTAIGTHTIVLSSSDDDSDDSSFVKGWNHAFGGSNVVAITAIIVGGLIAIALFAVPLLIVIAIIRYLTGRNKDKSYYYYQNMGNPQQHIPGDRQTPYTPDPAPNNFYDYEYEKAVKLLGTGIGLFLLFAFMGSDTLMGIGAMIAVMGCARLWLARRRRRHNEMFGNGTGRTWYSDTPNHTDNNANPNQTSDMSNPTNNDNKGQL